MLPEKMGCRGPHIARASNYIPLLMLRPVRARRRLARFESGADDYLPKPFNLAILSRELEACCGKDLLRSSKQSTPNPARARAIARHLSFWDKFLTSRIFACSGNKNSNSL